MNSLVINNYTINKPIYDILLQLRSELTNGKLARIVKKGSQISVTCPHHSDGTEKRNSCGIYVGDKETEYGSFNCFTCGEHGSFVHFVALCFDSSDEYAKKWLITHFGDKNTELTIDLEPINLNRCDKTTYLDENILKSFQSYHPYMDKRKLTKKVVEAFKIKYDPKSESLVFPVWDEQGRLVMLTRRSVNNKSFYIDKDKEKPVYLMNFIRERGITEVAVAESQINALTLWSWDVPAVATFGCNITQKQMDVFNKSNLRHIYLCFDGDAAGRKGTKKFIEQIRKDIFVDVIILPNGKDINDLSEAEFNTLPVLSSQEWYKKYGDKLLQ